MSSAADNAGKQAIDGFRAQRLSPESARLLIQTIEEVEREEARQQDLRKQRQAARTLSNQIEECPETD